jgi:predicted aconitase with swiveling domain
MLADSTRIVEFHARRSLAASVCGEAMVSQDAISLRYDIDPETGIVTRPSHDLYGACITGKVVIFRTTKGGVSAGWALLNLKQRGVAPLGLVCDITNPVFVQGAVLAEIPLMDGFEVSPRRCVCSGDQVALNGELKILRIVQDALR